jgi:hypothetical protein
MTAGLVQTQAVDPAPAAPESAPAAPPAPYVKYDLGPGGLIADWLVLGYLPGIQPAEKDRLGSIGGEGKVSPYGGETVTLKGEGEKGSDLTLTWKKAAAKKIEIPYWSIASKGLYLFTDETGKPIPNSTAYAYGELACVEDRSVILKMSGGEPIAIWLNGEIVPVADRSKWLSADAAKAALALKKGNNRLLVKISNNWDTEFVAMRLTENDGAPARSVQVQLKEVKDGPEMPCKYITQDWDALTKEIPPLAASGDAPLFGANLSRTMTLLETGGQTKRPVRILFYGQSITASEWVWLLTRRLRERYPNTEIEAENWAISGWGIDKLNCTIKHDILRAQPDLVVLHAYHGGSWGWERIIQKIRRETTAEIMIRSAHIGNYMVKATKGKTIDELAEEDSETLLLRRLARTYGCELVECRREWLSFLKEHKMVAMDCLADGIHLNRKGGVLMTQLYERHFRPNPAAQPWFNTVRRYEAMRPLADRCDDEIRLLGDGWKDGANNAFSTGKDDLLKLKFYGNRVDLVMPQCWGKAKVLIDGKPLSEWNLLNGPRPSPRGNVPWIMMTYYAGENMLEEDWELKFTHLSGDKQKFRFTLTGSKTGPDGEGDNSKLFVSNSKRITIKPFAYDDFLPNFKDPDKTKTELEPVTEDLAFTWSVKKMFKDEVCGIPTRKGEQHKPYYDHPYRYVTVADGLPRGEHELTLIPAYSERKEYFSIDAVEVHCPPLWQKKGE